MSEVKVEENRIDTRNIDRIVVIDMRKGVDLIAEGFVTREVNPLGCVELFLDTGYRVQLFLKNVVEL